MEISQIKDAIENIKEFYGEALYSKDAGIVTKSVETLLSLASDYIKFSGNRIMPEKKEHFANEGQGLTDFRDDFNACRHEVLVRMVGMEERIQKAIMLTNNLQLMMQGWGQIITPPSKNEKMEKGIREVLRDLIGQGWFGYRIGSNEFFDPEEDVDKAIEQNLAEFKEILRSKGVSEKIIAGL